MSLRDRLIGKLTGKRVLRSIVEIYVGVWLFAELLANRLMFHPPAREPVASDRHPRLVAPSGEHLATVWLPKPDARFTLLVSHGNGEDLTSDASLLRQLSHLGYGVFAYDYRGYGASEGSPSESNVYEDIDAAYRFLTVDQHIDPTHILVYGRSIGTGPSIRLAAQRPVGGLVLDSPFLSIFRVVTQARIYPFDRFVNGDEITQVTCPVLVIAAAGDHVVPSWQGHEIFARVRSEKRSLWLPGDGHTDGPWTSPVAYADALKQLADVAAARATPP